MDKAKQKDLVTIQLTLTARIFLDALPIRSLLIHDNQPERPSTIAARIKKFEGDLESTLRTMDQGRVTVQLTLTALIFLDGAMMRSWTDHDDQPEEVSTIAARIKKFEGDLGFSLENMAREIT